MKYPVGKLPLKALASLLDRNEIEDERVIVGPAIGEDAAVIDTGGANYLIAKTDPITFAADKIGWYAVNINANDIATMGASPQWFLATLLLPESQTEQSDVERIFEDILEACKNLGVSLIGGHTEITHDLKRPIVVGQMLGEVKKERMVRTSGARVGDSVIITKGIAVEGSAIIGREKAAELIAVIGREELMRMQNFLYDPGISVVKDALVAAEAAEIHSMHDPTEGGVATGLHEIAAAARVGLIIDAEALLIFPETRKLCDHYGLDPLGLIASGALIITCEAATADSLVTRLRAEGISAIVIGRIVQEREGIKIQDATGLRDLPIYKQDEVTKIFA
ncbi:MAG: AIR synthase family protein [Candidatus Binatia bacterium]